MTSDPETARRGPGGTAERPTEGEPEGRRAIESALDISLARGPEQEGGRRSTLPILVGLLVAVVILLIAIFA
ncbi:hypothetical protein [Inquilinus sp. Marseille-Q2685]|uniref:hypothetical protein n=1 Tax=Inquilinus sp. Marseille-Q2685 TaxID=2866581 RepID=UPI001CE3D894|nr:hypothetical protein [Inquilinus sp. Marseille-Q2685]